MINLITNLFRSTKEKLFLSLVLLCMTASAFSAGEFKRYGQTATLLADGKTLITGGQTESATVANLLVIDNPGGGTVTVVTPSGAGATLVSRSSHTATLLPNGKVFVVGGTSNITGSGALDTTYIFDPTDNSVVAGPTLNYARKLHTATLLRDGRVLILGGQAADDSAVSQTEIYSPATNTISLDSSLDLLTARFGHSATLIKSSGVFVAGGLTDSNRYVETTEIFTAGPEDPTTHLSALTRNPGPTLNQYRAYHTATAMNNGDILIIGGVHSRTVDGETKYYYLESVEKYEPESSRIVPITNMPLGLKGHTATLDPDGKVSVTGGMGTLDPFYITSSFEVKSSTIYITPTASSRGTITSGTTDIRTKIITNTTDALTGRFISGDIGFSQGYLSGFSTTINFTSDMHASMSGLVLYKGAIGQVVKLTNPAGSVVFDAIKGASPLSSAIGSSGCSFQYAGASSIPAATSASLVPGSSSCDMILTMKLPSNCYMNWSGTDQSTVKRAYLNMKGFDIIGNYNPGGGTIIGVHVSGTAGDNATTTLSPEPTVTRDSVNGVTASIEATVSNMVGSIENKSTSQAISVNPVPISGGNITSVTLDLYYVVSPITMDTVYITIPSTDSKYCIATAPLLNLADTLQYTSPTGTWEINPKPIANPPADSDSLAEVFPIHYHSSLLLPNGNRYIFGGRDCNNGTAPISICDTLGPMDQRTYYYPVVKDWTASGSMTYKRGQHTATILKTGKILITGGTDGKLTHTSSEIYDPTSGTWSVSGNLNIPRSKHTASLLPNGSVLVVGGYSQGNSTGTTATCEIYYPPSGRWTLTGSLSVPRESHSAVYLPRGANAGNIMVIGGYSNSTYLKTTEKYSPITGTWTVLASMTTPRSQHTATMLLDGRILVVGGVNATGTLASAEIYNPMTNTWGEVSVPSMTTKRHSHTATLLQDGSVLVTGGNDGGGEIDVPLVYNPTSNTWSTPTRKDMISKRQNHTSTLLPNGNILITGGVTATNKAIDLVENYIYEISSFTAQGTITTQRGYHTATLMPDGYVLLAGGYNGLDYVASSEKMYFMPYPDNTDLPSSRRPSGLTAAPTSFKHITSLTLRSSTSTFFGISEASGGGAGSANSVHDQPRVYINMIDNPSGYLVDMTKYLYTAYDSTNPNVWSKIDSSMTLTTPNLPYGWYNIRSAANAEFSTGYLLFVSSPVPTGKVANIVPESISSSGVAWRWLKNTVVSESEASADQVPADGFAVFSSTDDAFVANTAMVSGGADTVIRYTQTGLGPNTQAAIKVAPFNISDYGDFTYSTAAFYTYANPPTSLAVSSSSFNSATLTWDKNYNSDVTKYQLLMSNDGFTSNISTAVYFDQTGSTATTAIVRNLSPGQIYSFKVNARNGDSVQTAYSNVAQATTISYATNITGTAVSSGAITWTWLPSGSETHYELYDSSLDADALGNKVADTTALRSRIAVIRATENPAFTQTGVSFATSLTANTSYFIYIRALIATEAADGTITPSVIGNPVSSPSVYTLCEIPQPGTVPLTVSSDTMRGRWNAQSNPSGTAYLAELINSSDTVVSSVTVTQASDANMGYAFQSLIPNTLYKYRISAYNASGFRTAGTTYVTITTGTYTLSEAPGSVRITDVGFSQVTLTWRQMSNPTASTYYEVRRATYSTSYSNFDTVVSFDSQFTASTVTFTGLLTGTQYWFAVRTRNGNYNNTVFTPLVYTDTSGNQMPYVTTLTGPSGTPTGALAGYAGDGVISGTLADGRTITMTIPSGAFDDPKTQIAIAESATDPCNTAGSLPALPTLAIYTSSSVQPKKPVTLTFSYSTNSSSDELSGRDKDTIVLARYNETTRACLPQRTQVSLVPRTVTSTLNHFSRFQLMPSTQYSNLDNVFIYPNPFYPNRGQTYVTFTNLPASSKIRIYTLHGEELWSFSNTGISPILWDGRNSAGNAVASGVYLVVIEGGGGKKIFKVAVER